MSGNVYEWTRSKFADYPYQPDDEDRESLSDKNGARAGSGTRPTPGSTLSGSCSVFPRGQWVKEKETRKRNRNRKGKTKQYPKTSPFRLFEMKTRRSLRSRKVFSSNKRNGRWQKMKTNKSRRKSAAGSAQIFKIDFLTY